MTVELYHFWSSVCSVRCRMALEEKGMPWTSRYIDLFKFDQMQPAYLAINPRGMVPTLVHDGKPVRESSVINEYIDAAFTGPALTPPDPLGAARMREFVFLCDEGFTAIAKLTLVKYILPKLRNRWSDDELRQYYSQHQNEYNLPERVSASHILFKTQGKTPQEVEAIRAKAQQVLERAAGQLHGYFDGELVSFDLPLEPAGTAYRRSVWQALRDIPYGETRSYLEIAQLAGGSARSVGQANG